MRILHTEWSQGWGGQEIRIIAEMEAFRDWGYEMQIACHPESRIYGEASRRGFAAYSIAFGTEPFLTSIMGVVKLIKNIQPDIVHTHSSKDSWIAGLAAKLVRVPVVRSRHISALIKPKPTNGILYGWIPRAIITSGEIIAEQLIEATGVSSDKVFAVAPGADPGRFMPSPDDRAAVRKELDIPCDATVLGMVAVFRSWKGHCLFLEAVAPLIRSNPSIWIILVGDGPIRGEIEETICSLGIAERVILVGHRHDPERYFPALDIHLLPSLKNEGAPQAVPQAMMCGVANIVSNAGGLPEVIEDGVTGLIAKAGDIAALRKCVRALVDDPAQRSDFAAAGKRIACERFTVNRQVEMTATAYSSAAK